MPTVTRQRPSNKNHKPKPAAGPRPSPIKGQPTSKSEGSGLNTYGATTICHYGVSGVGKTSMWSFLPKVGFLFDPRDEGIEDLVRFGQCPEPHWQAQASDWDDTKRLLSEVANQEHGVEHLVVDSLTGFELFCFRAHCAENFGGDWSKEGFLAYQQGPKNAAKTDWPEFLDLLDDVRRSGISVVVIAHSQVKPFNNPDGENYDQHMPYLEKDTWQQTHRWAKAVLFHHIEVALEKKGTKWKARQDVSDRCIYTEPGPTFVAKNRWGIATRIDCGNSPRESYDNFMSAYLKAGKK